MENKVQDQLSSMDIEIILERLPEHIRESLVFRSTEIKYPIEAITEMAIESFLDTEALGFIDCKLGCGQ
jgi:hypothetical protein